MDRLSALFLALTIMLCAVTQVIGQQRQWNVRQFPNPRTQPDECSRPKSSSVCDPDKIISESDADAIDDAIAAVYRETTCLCVDCMSKNHGHIIRVAIMSSMKRVYPDGGNTMQDRLRDTQMYSYILSQQWQMEGACNESLLILYSTNDRILYTLTRQTTRQKLSDDLVKRVSMDVRHYFDDHATIGEGIKEMIRRYRLIFENKQEEAFQPRAGRQQG